MIFLLHFLSVCCIYLYGIYDSIYFCLSISCLYIYKHIVYDGSCPAPSSPSSSSSLSIFHVVGSLFYSSFPSRPSFFSSMGVFKLAFSAVYCSRHGSANPTHNQSDDDPQRSLCSLLSVIAANSPTMDRTRRRSGGECIMRNKTKSETENRKNK